MKLVATKSFKSEIYLEYSCTSQRDNMGMFDNEMSFYVDKYKNKGFIEWAYENNDNEGDAVEIGIWFDDDKNITDYDGVFELPEQAISLLIENGYNCDDM